MWIINNRKLFYTFSGILVAASLLSLFVWGLKPGIDFTGGSLIDVSYSSRPDQSVVEAAVRAIDPSASVRPSGSDEYIVRMKAIDQNEKLAVMSALGVNSAADAASSTEVLPTSIGPKPVSNSTVSASTTAPVAGLTTLKTFDSIGPVLGAEALRKAYVSVILVILGIVLFITFAFRKVSEPVSSWKYGLTAIIGLVHNVLITMGVFSILGHLASYEVDTLFVTALLVILGFSVHDTIVVFDRVRENLRVLGAKKPFNEVVGASISQTFTRSINTSLTTLLALVVLYIMGGATTEHFCLALIIGIAAGTYASIFIGSPLLVTIEKWGKGKIK
jgi:preprotein translocase subunit SecF